MSLMRHIGPRLVLASERTSASGTSVIAARIEVDFGSLPIWEKKVTVLNPLVPTDAIVFAAVSRIIGTGHADDDELDAFTVKTGNTTGGDFSMVIQSLQGPVFGKYMVDYAVVGTA